MAPLLLTGLAAGLASALLFLSVTTGSVLAILLFYIAPLPVMIAALGWSHRAGLMASAIAALGLGIGIAPSLGGLFLLSVALPAWLLAYLTLLGNRENGSVTEWFPVGGLVAVASLIGGCLAAIAIVSLGGSLETVQGGIRETLTAMMSAPGGAPPPADLVELFVVIMPPLGAIMWVITTLFNLWLAARIVRRSDRLPRPWPAIRELRLPRPAIIALVVATVAGFLPGLAGFIAELFAATFLAAFAIAGFAVLHALSLGNPFRPLLLGGVYFVAFIMGWALLFVAMLGIADHVMDLRARQASKRGGPPSST